MGAYKNQLVGQYLVESWVLAMVSFVLSIAWIEIARPLFENLTGKEILRLYSVDTITTLLVIATIVGLLSGIYPSLVLSSFKTVNVLKGQFNSGTTGAWLRKSLVVFQYSVTIILIASIFVTQLQLRFIRQKDLGYNKENLLILNVNGSPEVKSGYQAFKNDLLSDPSISGFATSNAMISGGLSNSTATIEDATGKKISGTIFKNGIDADYLETYGMKLIAGRNFIKGAMADSLGLIVNEATTRAYGYDDPNDAIGTEIILGEGKGQVIGVVSDFHYNSLHKKIEPTCMFLWRGGFSRIAVRFDDNILEGVDRVSKAWKKHFPNSVLEYAFAEQRLEDQYRAEQRFSKIFLFFSVISLTIACLGLFALVSHAVKSRTKEIGIRKVLGASVAGIVTMLSHEFIMLIFIACLIAMTLSYYFMQQSLQSFEYRVNIGVETFIIAGAIALLIAIATISMKSIRSALANPVDSLRNE